MHPGPMNRGVEIDSAVADDPLHSVIREQVEMGVAVRMAVLDRLARPQGTPGGPGALGVGRGNASLGVAGQDEDGADEAWNDKPWGGES